MPDPKSIVEFKKVKDSDLVVQVWTDRTFGDKHAAILIRNKDRRHGFMAVVMKEHTVCIDFNTMSDSRAEVLDRCFNKGAGRGCEFFVFENQNEFFTACIDNNWKFIR